MIRSESLPYFGKINSISRIEKIDNDIHGKYYLIKRYDANGNEKKETFFVSVSLKNVTGILKDYCIDLNDYLMKNKNKYISYKNKKRYFNINVSMDKLDFSSFLAKAGICFGTGLVGITFTIPSVPVLFYVGITILLASSTGVMVISDLKKELDEVMFVNQYDNYTEKLSKYRSYIEESNEKRLTQYRGVVHEKNKGNILKMKKLKTLN